MKHLLLLSALSCALRAQTLEGAWQGTLSNPNGEIRLVFSIAKNGDAYAGRFINLANGRQFPLGAITLQGTAVKLVIPGNGMTYDGRLEADGNSITGSLSQGTNPTPLPLKRATPETAWDLPPSAAAPQGVPAGTKLEFVAATIKPSGAAPQGPGVNVTDREVRARSISLANLISFAYNLHPQQIAGLPDWAQADGYEIVAALPPGGEAATDAQIFAMLQDLIRSRFNVRSHTEKREASVYTLGIGKNGLAGLKLVRNTANGARINAQGLGRISVSGITMGFFAGQLQQRVLDRPVLDQTGLTDRYDFTLNWKPDEFQYPNFTAVQREYWAASAAAEGFPDLSTALLELGLRLDATKAPTDTLVIDQVSRPTEN